MAAISAAMVKELRERTGLGMMECKKALVETDGDIDVAIDNLRKASGLKAAKKADRTAADGVVAVKVADDASYGVLVEVNSETDFVARDDNFLAFVGQVVEKAFADKQADVAALMEGDLENAREALVQKIGENISVRRIAIVEGAVVGGYVHSNNRIAVLSSLSGGEEKTFLCTCLRLTHKWLTLTTCQQTWLRKRKKSSRPSLIWKVSLTKSLRK